MSTAEEKAGMLRKQVIAKIHWDPRGQEVLDWLQEEKGITGDEAQRLLAQAYRARSAAIRTRAVMTLIFSVLGVGFAAAYFGSQYFGGFIRIGPRPVFVAAIGVLSLSWLMKSLLRILTGKTEGPVD